MIDKSHDPATASTRPAASPASRASRSLRLRAVTLLVAATLSLALTSGSETSPTAPSSATPRGDLATEGSFDLAAVEDLALFFATESMRRLRIPLLLRLVTSSKNEPTKQERIDEILADPPRADAQGVVYPFGDKNALSLVYNSDTRSMSCWERLVKKYGSTGMLGLTGPEMAAALNAVSSRDKDRGGGDFAYDPIRDAVSLRRTYLHPPADRDLFYKELHRLLMTELKWEKGLYLKKAVPIVESRRPPDTATAASEGFAATLVLRHFSAEPSETGHWLERYLRTWDRQPGGLTPSLVSDRTLRVDQILHAFIHFQGARNGARGQAAVDATFRLVAPDGSESFANLTVPLWRAAAQPANHLQIGANDFSFSLDEEEPTGTYRLEAEVCDTATGRCVQLAHPFVLQPG